MQVYLFSIIIKLNWHLTKKSRTQTIIIAQKTNVVKFVFVVSSIYISGFVDIISFQRKLGIIIIILNKL